jgi:hexosaminidase
MKKILAIALLFSSVITVGQINITPTPVEFKIKTGKLVLKEPIGFIYNDAFENEKEDGGVALFKKYLTKKFGFKKFVDGDTHSYGLPTEIFISIDNVRKDEGYSIEVKNKAIVIDGNSKGIFYGLQTLTQLIEQSNNQQRPTKISIPQLSITDQPRFNYRGMHLDVARHFYPISYIKKYIDYLAAYKFNTFHWHLTDDQGWRIEIKKYPLLTKVGGYRNGTIIGRYPGKGNDSLRYGGFYTQAQIKEIVQYAADRYITVIPEIEMPGHASAAIAAYPQLSCFPNEDTKVPKDCTWSGSTKGKQVQQTWGVFEDVFAPTDYTFNFLQDVLDEVIPLFPSKYIHIGGDECPKENWKRSEFCQQLIKNKNLTDEHGLQSYFIGRIEKYLNSKGKNIIGWDEILEGGLAPNATVMSWRGEAGGIEAAKQKHTVIMTPGKPVYFDHSQSKNEDSVTIGGYNSLEDVYNYEPVPKELNADQAKYILGAQANLWTEYIKNERKVEYQLFPRLFALSEVLWTPKEKRNWNDFEKRLTSLFKSLDNKKINYSKAYFDLKISVLPTENNDGVIFSIGDSLKPNYFMVERMKKGSSGITNSLIHKKNLQTKIKESGEFMWATVSDTLLNYGTKTLNYGFQKLFFNKATGKKITLKTEASKNYPGDGAFTLVNGVQNEKGLAKSSEFLGFSGTNLEATIDFGKEEKIYEVRLHTFTQIGSWIYPPAQGINVSISNDGITYSTPEELIQTVKPDKDGIIKINFSLKHKIVSARYIKIIAKNYGIIPSGNPGAGNPAWLFVDEIEVE